jgi:type III pantothenate kinase
VKLLLDIGNSKIGLALMSKGKVIRAARLEHGGKTDYNQVYSFLERSVGVKSVKAAAICSVVPELTRITVNAVRDLLGINAQIAGLAELKGFHTNYRKPEQLGADRLVAAYAAARLYGGPLIVIDMGTAITWDAVDARGRHLGGAIAPGPATMAQSLQQSTALLPGLAFKKSSRAIGRDTRECILSGIQGAAAGAVKELHARISREMKACPKVVLTGGLAGLAALSFKKAIADPWLIYKGLNLLLEEKERI